jgi:hypothetical protein
MSHLIAGAIVRQDTPTLQARGKRLEAVGAATGR